MNVEVQELQDVQLDVTICEIEKRVQGYGSATLYLKAISDVDNQHVRAGLIHGGPLDILEQ